MKIKHIEKYSIADQIDLKIGDVVESINGNSIKDIIDYRFYISDEFVTLKVNRNGEILLFDFEKDDDDDLGLTFDPIQYRCCGNNCIFCFVDQNPQNLRKNLYFKDEDFRLSFLHGNYVTMTNISTTDLQRIVQQRLSPIYISVHAIDPEVRKLMLGLKKDDHLLEKITYLADHHIEMHAQVVFCPGMNDGKYLDQTIVHLSKFYPHVNSIAIVPVGLTKHRDHLYPLQAVTSKIAKDLIDQIEPIAGRYKKSLGSFFVFLADEFYLLSAYAIPQAARYENYPQYENGVGMLRFFMDEFVEQSYRLPEKITNPVTLRIVTAELASKFLENTVIPRLNAIDGVLVDLSVIANNFYGKSVKVTGLLTGADIYEQIKNKPPVDLILLPENCLNDDGLMLDDWTTDILSQKLNQRIKIIGLDLSEIFREK